MGNFCNCLQLICILIKVKMTKQYLLSTHVVFFSINGNEWEYIFLNIPKIVGQNYFTAFSKFCMNVYS